MAAEVDYAWRWETETGTGRRVESVEPTATLPYRNLERALRISFSVAELARGLALAGP